MSNEEQAQLTLEQREQQIRESMGRRVEEQEEEQTAVEPDADKVEDKKEEPKQEEKPKKKYLDKYDTDEELAKGYKNLEVMHGKKEQEWQSEKAAMLERLNEMHERIEKMSEGPAKDKAEKRLDEKQNEYNFLDEYEKNPEAAIDALIEKRMGDRLKKVDQVVSERENVRAIENVASEIEGFDEYIPHVASFIRTQRKFYESMVESVGVEGALKAIYLMASGAKGKEEAGKMRETLEQQIRTEYEERAKKEKSAFVERGGSTVQNEKKEKTLAEREEEIRKMF